MNEGMEHHSPSKTCTDRFHSGREVGDRVTVAEIWQAKDKDFVYQNMGEAEHKEAVDQVIAYWQGKSHNAHITSKGAACDIFATMERVEKEVKYI